MRAALRPLLDQYGLSVQLSDYHRAQLHRAGVVLAAVVVALNVAIVLTAGLVAVWRHL